MITEPFKFGEFKHKVTPMAHQEKTFLETRELKRYGLFWEMGCAKTKPTIDTAAWLFLKGEIDGLLVISDKGAYRNWTDTEIPIHMPDNIPYRQAVWKSTWTSKKAEAQTNQLLVARDNVLDIVVMNVEAFAREKAQAFAAAFLENHYGMIVVDESDSIKTITSKRTQAIIQLRDLAEYRRILTGTPITNSPLDIYAQAEFLEQGLLGESFVLFTAQYAIRILDMSIRGAKPHYKIIGYQNINQLNERVKAWSSRLLKTQCLDLPPKIYDVRYVEHTPEQKKMYKELKETALTEWAGGMLTVTSALTCLMKLHQINCGHVKLNPLSEDEDAPCVEIPSNRINELLYVLKQTSGKVIIWATFQKDFELIGKALSEEYGAGSWVDYYGLTPENQRVVNIGKFRTTPEVRFFVSNPATGGRGITLVEADYAVYYSYNWRLAFRLQSEDRNHRKGQTKPCTYIDLCTHNTIDVRIRHSWKVKKDLASCVLDNFVELLKDEDEEDSVVTHGV